MTIFLILPSLPLAGYRKIPFAELDDGNLSFRKRSSFLRRRQEDLARICGVMLKTIHLAKQVKRNPSFETLEKLVSIFGLQIHFARQNNRNRAKDGVFLIANLPVTGKNRMMAQILNLTIRIIFSAHR
jgi:DNA-binding XRE family transcriptional regulator